jgi:3-hydroxyisobutyrate dehydrogenase-like beta-hydroxyacid dehydrogenase
MHFPALRDCTIGLAGCGTMGLPMAQMLHAAGFDVYGHDVRPMHEFAEFETRMLADASEFAARTDIVISVVRDVAQTQSLCFGAQAIFSSPDAPRTLIVSSTLSPGYLPELRAALPSIVNLMDAPMSGAPHAARAGTLSFMLGGDDDLINWLMPLFECMGGQVFRLGGLASGMTAKVLNNYVACSNVAIVRRCYARAAALGVDLAPLREVMRASSGSTWFGDNFFDIDWSREGYAKTNTYGILEKDVMSCLDAVALLPDVAADGLDEAILDALRGSEPFDLGGPPLPQPPGEGGTKNHD